jgi:hypothetical protein
LLVLASASPRRLDLLRQIGLEPAVIDPADTDETPAAAEAPRVYALRMAMAKLAVVAPRHPGATVLAAASVVAQHTLDRIARAGNAGGEICRRRRIEREPAELLPVFDHLAPIGAQHVGRRAGGRSAQHDPSIEHVGDVTLQALAFGFAFDAPREAHAGTQRMIDEVPAGHGDIHRQAGPLVALAVIAHLHQHRSAGRRPAVDPGTVLAAQEAGATRADVDERGIEIRHHPFEPAKEHAVDRRRTVAPCDLQFGQAAACSQRHQEGPRQHLDDQTVGPVHGDAARSMAAVSNSGSPTTLL